MKINIKSIILSMALTFSVMTAGAIELPTTTIAGQPCYYYDVKPKENIYTIADALGITRSDIVKYNPAVADGLRPGTRLYFPTSLFGDKVKAAPTPTPTPTAAESTSATTATTAKTATIATAATTVEQPAAEEPATVDVSESLANTVAHKVKRGESLYGIARKYGISMETLIAYNPGSENGVEKGDILVIPLSDNNIATAAPEETPLNENVAEQTADGQETDPTDPTDLYAMPDPLNIAVILPFMLQEEEPSKTAQLYTEFYKGFLLAADSLKDAGNTPVNIYVYDSAGSNDTVAAIISRPEFASMNMVIAPDNEEQLVAIVDGVSSDTYILNPFIVRNELQNTRSNMMQVNIPHSGMYEKAINGLRELYPHHTPVFLSRIDGAADKDSFISALKERLAGDSVEYVDLTFRNLLSDKDLESLADDRDYIFIPVSGNRSEFAKITSALKRFRDNRFTRSTVLFGYPEWTTFRGDYYNRLCDLNATIYTRWYADMNSPAVERFTDRFNSVYGGELLDAVPNQGLLGFDLGFYAINALRDTNGDMHARVIPYNGLQSSFNFSDNNISGLVNNSLMFVTFGNGDMIVKQNF